MSGFTAPGLVQVKVRSTGGRGRTIRRKLRHESDDLAGRAASGPALFANDSMALLPAALSVVGHGAANLVGSGSSGDNRRVVVVIEEPASWRRA